MSLLHPAFDSIRASYAAWLDRPAAAGARTTLDPVVDATEHSPQDAYATGAEFNQTSTAPPLPPRWITELIVRQVATRPRWLPPQSGDLVLLQPPHADAHSLPLVVLLDAQDAQGAWHGWLVGAHTDYAGSQDLILDETLLVDAVAPAPLAGFVQCWNPVLCVVPAPAAVLQRLTPQALALVHALARRAAPTDIPSQPGTLFARVLDGGLHYTGTAYGRDDPRSPYLALCRALAKACMRRRHLPDPRLPPPVPQR